MSHGKSSRSGSSQQPPRQRNSGRGDESLPGRPFSLPPGYYDYYGIPRPEPAQGSIQAKRSGLNQGPHLPLGLLEYYGIVPRTASESPPSPVQQKGSAFQNKVERAHEAAAHGTRGPSGALPFIEEIQKSFGGHDVSHVKAHTDSQAAAGARAMGAEAFTTGEHVAFAEAPSLHLAAHEAAHVIQQQAGVQLKGGVGEVGDRYEQHADAVADLVVQGKSSEALLDEYAGMARPNTDADRPGGSDPRQVLGRATQLQIQRNPLRPKGGAQVGTPQDPYEPSDADVAKAVAWGQDAKNGPGPATLAAIQAALGIAKSGTYDEATARAVFQK
jgi:hypothetical protein